MKNIKNDRYLAIFTNGNSTNYFDDMNCNRLYFFKEFEEVEYSCFPKDKTLLKDNIKNYDNIYLYKKSVNYSENKYNIVYALYVKDEYCIKY